MGVISGTSAREPSHTPSLRLHTPINGLFETSLHYPGDPGGLTTWVLGRALHPAPPLPVPSCCSTPAPRGFDGVSHVFHIVLVALWPPSVSGVLLAVSTEGKDEEHMGTPGKMIPCCGVTGLPGPGTPPPPSTPLHPFLAHTSQ